MKAISLWQSYLAGVLHGDGWCGSAIGLRCKDYDFSLAFAAALNRGFSLGKKPKRDERGYWLVRVGNKGGKFDGLRAYEPTSNEERAAWLRGLFDSEGNAQVLEQPHVGPNSLHRRVAFYSTDLATLGIAAAYLHALGIAHSIRLTKNSASHKGTKPVTELRLCRREAFQSFALIVGSNIARKQERLDKIANSYQPHGWQVAAQALGVIARRANKARRLQCGQ